MKTDQFVHVTVAPRHPDAPPHPLFDFDNEFPKTIGGSDGSIVMFAFINDSEERLVVRAKATFPAATDGQGAPVLVQQNVENAKKG